MPPRDLAPLLGELLNCLKKALTEFAGIFEFLFWIVDPRCQWYSSLLRNKRTAYIRLNQTAGIARSQLMKITINIDCTPAEARQYMGLPDVAPMQEAMLKELQERMTANLTALQPTEMIKAWFPMGMDRWLEMQKTFWTQVTSIGARGDDKS